MSSNNSGMNDKLVAKKVEDVNKVNTYAASEIGFPNNKDKRKGKEEEEGIVGKG